MDDLTNRFSRLGQKIAEVSDRVADPATLPNARRRFLSGSSEAEMAVPKRLTGRRLRVCA